MSAPAIRLDIVSDIVCPWCAIGLAAVEQAIERLDGAADVTLAFHPLELNPGLPPEGEKIADNLARKYGAGPDQARAAGDRIRTAAAELGVDMRGRSDRLYDTFDAHRLLHWAGTIGDQLPLKKALLARYFAEGQNVSDPDVLAGAAADAGLDADEARAVLADGRFAGDVRAAERYWRDEGVLSVPTLILDGRYAIPGAQSVERLERALRRRMTDA
ncbi:disulfide bond formation protein DsbA [Sphingomonas ginsenosidimutans]|uniref:Disulfide bond formation protein DsbA n=1 Tax=Sphingomonas ginsenosidimutans TaxID=862134 RepID=A0A2A4I3H2_9SPHN|nr:DsbA family oxidoreductase [Sphingomonas ginsenosidimutans]PCG10468.1 disulfide bond formation protein DsbA [Sphingomonas ginsenosidimutans]